MPLRAIGERNPEQGPRLILALHPSCPAPPPRSSPPHPESRARPDDQWITPGRSKNQEPMREQPKGREGGQESGLACSTSRDPLGTGTPPARLARNQRSSSSSRGPVLDPKKRRGRWLQEQGKYTTKDKSRVKRVPAPPPSLSSLAPPSETFQVTLAFWRSELSARKKDDVDSKSRNTKK